MSAPVVDLPALRAYLLAHAVPGVDDVEVLTDGSTHHMRLVPTAAGPTLLTATLPAADSAEPSLHAEGPDRSAVEDALAAGRRWLALDDDPADGVAALADDPVLGPLVRARPFVRVPGATDPFEAAVTVVLGQHVSLAAGRVFAGRLAAAHGVGCPGGRPGSHPGTRLVAFPTAQALAGVEPQALKEVVGVTGARAATVVALARAVADGLDLSPAADDPDRRSIARRALLALPGVGPWTADLVALRCLREPDVFLPGDLVLRKAMGGVTAAEADRAAQAWAPHRSLAVLHLWTHHAIDPPRPTPA